MAVSSTRRARSTATAYALLAPSPLGTVVLLLVPVAVALWLSLHRWDLVSPPTGAGLDNCASVATDAGIRRSSVVAVLLTALVIPVQTALGLLVAVLLARRLPGSTALRVLFVVPWISAPLVVGLVWRWVLDRTTGVLNALLGVRVEWLSSHSPALPADVAGGTLPDVLWVNSSDYGPYVDAGTFLSITDELPDTVAGFQPSVVDQSTRDGSLYGVPQLSDAIGLFSDADLTTAAGVDPTAPAWDPTGTADTFLPAARALTTSGGARQQFGFNAAFDLQAIYDDSVGSDGGAWQADGAQFSWKVAPALTGPAGRVTVTNGIVAVRNAKSPREDAAVKVLEWLASAEGAGCIGAEGAAFPAVTAAQQGHLDCWKGQGVDVQPFLDAAAGETIEAPHGPKANAAAQAAEPVLQQVFAGRLDVATGMQQAQEAANAAITA